MEQETSASRKKIIKDIELPEGVIASLSGQALMINGPKGEVKRQLRQHNVSLKVGNKKITLEYGNASKKDKKMIGTLAAHIKNMIKGSMHSHTYTLKICSGHFPMNVSVSGDKLTVKNFLGEKIPRVLRLKQGMNIKIEGDLIHITSASKETAGQVSADIEQMTRRPGYDTRVFQDGIYIINKDGKELK